MAPTLVAMEPCSGAHQIAEQIQELGHEVMMISGRHVQAWVKDHCNGQKTDLNDAFAILNLAYDRWLTPIRGKTREECRLLALQASYRRLWCTSRLRSMHGDSPFVRAPSTKRFCMS